MYYVLSNHTKKRSTIFKICIRYAISDIPSNSLAELVPVF